jgi:predicted kinase
LSKNRGVDDRRTLPLLALISGAPGSGKSTLAEELAAALGLPRLSRDELWSGLRFTHARGAPAIVATRGVVAEYGALEYLLALGVSVVADGTLYRGEMEGNIRRLCDLAEVVNLHCMSSAALDRYRQRQLSSGIAVDVVDATLQDLEARQDQFTSPLDLACRQILVSNEAGFDPSIEELVAALG